MVNQIYNLNFMLFKQKYTKFLNSRVSFFLQQVPFILQRVTFFCNGCYFFYTRCYFFHTSVYWVNIEHLNLSTWCYIDFINIKSIFVLCALVYYFFHLLGDFDQISTFIVLSKLSFWVSLFENFEHRFQIHGIDYV